MTGPSSMRCSLLAASVLLALGATVVAQDSPFNLGRTPTEQELRQPDAAVGPDGEGLPPGRGTAREGAVGLYRRGAAPRVTGHPGQEARGLVWSARLTRAGMWESRAIRLRRSSGATSTK